MSVSNKDVEVLSEALFCYYFAIYKKGKQKKQVEKLSEDPIQYDNFFIPQKAHWNYLKDIK